MNQKKPKVAELFAGVGGFRLGLEKAGWEINFSNQWEPSTRKQHASSVYIANFGADGHSNIDIAKLKNIPTQFDLLVGGFPCQDYSVAKGNSGKGIKGKKGVLWWQILRLVRLHKPRFILLENVERLLKSPVQQRGRDFAIMLRTLGDVGYQIEWRVVNSADYGFPQRRIRVFILATKIASKTKVNPKNFFAEKSILTRAFPATFDDEFSEVLIEKNATELSRKFNKSQTGISPFLNSGVYYNGIAYTRKVSVKIRKEDIETLGSILQNNSEVDDRFFIKASQLSEWKFQKGAKNLMRSHKSSGFTYTYSEGAIAFPDLLTNPSRTILTGEGGSGPSRFKHVVKVRNRFRRLTPIELERLNGFPDNWTKFDYEGNELSESRRGFFMGNALVVGLVYKIGKELIKEF